MYNNVWSWNSTLETYLCLCMYARACEYSYASSVPVVILSLVMMLCMCVCDNMFVHMFTTDSILYGFCAFGLCRLKFAWICVCGTMSVNMYTRDWLGSGMCVIDWGGAGADLLVHHTARFSDSQYGSHLYLPVCMHACVLSQVSAYTRDALLADRLLVGPEWSFWLVCLCVRWSFCWYPSKFIAMLWHICMCRMAILAFTSLATKGI